MWNNHNYFRFLEKFNFNNKYLKRKEKSCQNEEMKKGGVSEESYCQTKQIR